MHIYNLKEWNYKLELFVKHIYLINKHTKLNRCMINFYSEMVQYIISEIICTKWFFGLLEILWCLSDHACLHWLIKAKGRQICNGSSYAFAMFARMIVYVVGKITTTCQGILMIIAITSLFVYIPFVWL